LVEGELRIFQSTKNNENISDTTIATSICRDMEEITAISWECLSSETKKDQILSTLFNALTSSNIEWAGNPVLKVYTK